MQKTGLFGLGENEMSILCSLNKGELVSEDQIRRNLGSLYGEFFKGGSAALKRTLNSLKEKKLIEENKEKFKITKYGYYQKEVLRVNNYCKSLYMMKKK